MNSVLVAWITELDDNYLSDWANRGLLRRGRKLADSLEPTVCRFDEEVFTAGIDGHQQHLGAAGFDQLSCSCPATGACHHLIAFLLCLQHHSAVQSGVQETTGATAPSPWLDSDFDNLAKCVGQAHIKRANRLLLQNVAIELADSATGLVASVTEGQCHTVRIPRSMGLAASTCTCAAERCVHRAVAVLAARQRAGLYDPLAEQQSALTAEQLAVVAQLQDWLRGLVLQGSSGVSRSLIDRGGALTSVARQAELPWLASIIAALVSRQEDELTGKSFTDSARWRSNLTDLWLRLRALQQTPLAQPLERLAGNHRRNYRLVQNLELIGVGAEIWRSATAYLGLSLHLYAPTEQRWYRLGEARPAWQTDAIPWTPENCWRHNVWTAGLSYREIPGKTLRLHRGWITDDGRLSGRDGTQVEVVAETKQLPQCADFTDLGQYYGQILIEEPAAIPPRLPVLLALADAEAPCFDASAQIWSQIVFDKHHNAQSLNVSASDDSSARIIKRLEQLWRNRQRWLLVFGWLSYQRRSLQVYPISIQCRGEQQWRHLSLP